MSWNIVLVWVGGSGISGLAHLFMSVGYKNVIGIDSSANTVTDFLMTQGIQIIIWHHQYTVSPQDFVVYSDATVSSPEVLQAKENAMADPKHFRYPMSYFEFVWEISKYMHTIAIAGTHGKSTTTSMMISTVYDHPDFGLWIVWAQMKQFEWANVVIAWDKHKEIAHILGHLVSAKTPLTEYDLIKKYRFVIEADEFHRHFLLLDIDHLLITNIQRDHPDTYPTPEQYMDVFDQCINRTRLSITMLDDGLHLELKKKYADRIRLSPFLTYHFAHIFGSHNQANASLVETFLQNQYLLWLSTKNIDSTIIYRDDLGPDDRQIHKKIKLEMLQQEPEAFGHGSYQAEFSYPDTYWQDFLRDPVRYGIYVFDGDQVIWSMHAQASDDPQIGKISWVYLHPDYRWQGIADHMLHKCMDFLYTHLGLWSIKILVHKTQLRALSYYRKRTFHITGEEIFVHHGESIPLYHLKHENIHTRLESYLWIHRRCELLWKTASGACVYSDYAHHPTEVQSTYQSLCDRFGVDHITVIYQPHQAGRILSLRTDMIRVCQTINHLFLYKIYTAREDVPSLLSQYHDGTLWWLKDADALWQLLADYTESEYITDIDTILTLIDSFDSDHVVCIMSAGDLDGYVRKHLKY
jgi:UDP-N-acetylmuramate-alanine ligase/ribosomal protein S18 acetylase RimI-like enzyme